MSANGDTIEALLEVYLSIRREDILACLEYAGTLAEKTHTDWGVCKLAMKILVDEKYPIDC